MSSKSKSSPSGWMARVRTWTRRLSPIRAVQVTGPTSPSGLRPAAVWNRLMASRPQRAVISTEPAEWTELSISWTGESLTVELTSPHNADVAGLGRHADPGELARVVGTALQSPNSESITGLGTKLARALPTDVVEALEAIPDDRIIMLRLAPDIASVPWELTTIGGKSLSLRPVCRAPVRSTATARGAPTLGDHLRVLLIGDTTDGDGSMLPPLPGAREEVEVLAQLYAATDADVRLLVGNKQATFDSVVTEISDSWFDVIHFAGHGYLEDKAYLVLAGGDKLYSSDLRALLRPRLPALVFLDTRYTSFGARRRLAPQRTRRGSAAPR